MFIILIIGLILIITFIVIFILIKKRKNHIGEIHTTYDGLTNGRKHVKKKRKVVIVDQNLNDELVVSKLHEYDESRVPYSIPDVVLKPDDHPSLTKNTLIENKTMYGFKQENGKYKTIVIDDLDKKPDGTSYENTFDKLTIDELNKVNKHVKKERKKSKRKKTIHKTWKKGKLKDK